MSWFLVANSSARACRPRSWDPWAVPLLVEEQLTPHLQAPTQHRVYLVPDHSSCSIAGMFCTRVALRSIWLASIFNLDVAHVLSNILLLNHTIVFQLLAAGQAIAITNKKQQVSSVYWWILTYLHSLDIIIVRWLTEHYSFGKKTEHYSCFFCRF